MVSLPAKCPNCGSDAGMRWCPGDSYIFCKAGLCDYGEHTSYLEFSRSSEIAPCTGVMLALRTGRYAESGHLARLRVRACAHPDLVRIESAYLWERARVERKLSVSPVEAIVVSELRAAGIPARLWQAGDHWV